jgi:hypothetical protein
MDDVQIWWLYQQQEEEFLTQIESVAVG